MENRTNHGDGISGRQLRELLRSLPAAHAPEDLELNLLYRIAENNSFPHRVRSRVPHSMKRRRTTLQHVTRPADRVRGLVAAAVAAFLITGSWTLYSNRTETVPAYAPALRFEEAFPVTPALPPLVEENALVAPGTQAEPLPKTETTQAEVLQAEESRVVREQTERTVSTTSSRSLNTASERAIQREPSSREELHTTPAASMPVTPATQNVSAPQVAPHPSGAPSPDSVSAGPMRDTLPDASGVGTGGEPEEDETQNES